MPTEKSSREFLLGMSDPETEHLIEEGLLDGSLDIDHLRCLEDELIDDYVFGRLTKQDEAKFLRHFLCTNERKEKFAFSRSIQRYASKETSPTLPLKRFLPVFPAQFWGLSLSTVLAGMLGIVFWLGIRDARLSRELAQARIAGNERDRLQLELTEERNRTSLLSAPTTKIPSGEAPAGIHLRNVQRSPNLTLAPGLARGIERVPVLQIPPREDMVWIKLQISSDPGGAFREELFGGNGERIWSQEFFSTHSLLNQREMTVGIPALLLQPGDYRIKLEERSGTGAFEILDTYSFRVAD